MALVRDGAPALTRGSWFMAVVNREDAVTSYTLKAALELTSFESISPLPLEQDQTSSVPGGPALGPVQHAFDVAAAAGKRLAVTMSGSQDCDLYLRFGKPVELGLEGQILADVVAASPSPSEAMGLDEASLPTLQVGTYYLAVRNTAEGPLTYTVRASLADVVPPSPGTEPLSPGESKASVAAGASPSTARLSDLQFTVAVPEDGAKLIVELSSTADLGLYLRHGERVTLEAGRLRFDRSSDFPGTGNEKIVAGLLSTPRLEPGTYHVPVASRSPDAAGFTLKATLETAQSQAAIADLTNGQWVEVRVPGAGGNPAPVLHGTQFRLRVGAGSPGLDVLTNPKTAGDVDLYVRRGRPVQRLPDGVVADFLAETQRGAESIAVFKEDLTPGDYYVALGTRSPTETVLDVIAVFVGEFPISLPVGENDLYEDVLNAAAGGGNCRLSLNQFAVRVAANATRLEVDVMPLDGGPLNVLARYEGRILVDRGAAVFDDIGADAKELLITAWAGLCAEADVDLLVTLGERVTWTAADESTNADWKASRRGPGAETVVINAASNPPIAAGIYYLALVNRGQAAVAIRMGAGAFDVQSVPLQNGKALSDTIATAGRPGAGLLQAKQYRIEVPPKATELRASLAPRGAPSQDIDLFGRFGLGVFVGSDGRPAADVLSERANTGIESVAFPAPDDCLRPGTYFLAVGNFHTSPVTFDLIATVTSVDTPFRRGDANEDDKVDLSDGVTILSYLFRGATTICLDAADTEVNQELNITDAIFLLQFLFLGGPAPRAPFPDCGLGDGASLGGCTGEACE
ncbi:MAG: hypothetical protein HY721_30055 [Planctomycetes bacterium]|nr:hypothetical protein [Planctomycetota bacterium]